MSIPIGAWIRSISSWLQPSAFQAFCPLAGGPAAADSIGSIAAHGREAAAPNNLWQMDFKGQFGLTAGSECYPFTSIDDHSRFLVGLTACAIDYFLNQSQVKVDLAGSSNFPERSERRVASPYVSIWAVVQGLV
jgi:hypothetical protein